MISYSDGDLDAPVQSQPFHAEEAMNPNEMLVDSWCRRGDGSLEQIPEGALDLSLAGSWRFWGRDQPWAEQPRAGRSTRRREGALERGKDTTTRIVGRVQPRG